ncbi:MAG: LLM class flavin-dependent oxidoreductase [Gemmatimonas sp.]
MQLGIYTFVDIAHDSATGRQVNAAQRVREVIEEIELADQVGLDVFGIGEHHRIDYVASAPNIILAAAAERTRQIRLTSAVTVLSSDDPVRVFQQFSTLDLISGGRAEIMAGRGSFIESFPLFGYDLDDYDALFAEKIELLLKICDNERVTWKGQLRAPIHDLPVYPRPVQDPLPVWIAVGGNPPSVVRAAMLGVPMALAIIGGEPERFAPFVQLYRDSLLRAGREPDALPVSINSHGYIAANSQDAANEYFPAYSEVFGRIGRERGWPPPTRAQFEASRTLRGALFVGSPQEVVDKILFQHGIFGHQRFLMQLGMGTMTHAQTMRNIELFGSQVAPAVRKALSSS